ncbi:integumentary mucin C.1 [Lingula anatina]|uniref:Integumentary mucin C.1 n=1 Tax=Lingula anatina TaxID=7574 RepID=A0A1S3KHB8_LINAN|nr:integumentary mucin C.1 [Lingula anatina]|eukprot:XP_013421869.1 integumentary mucin C.1 [Lingula anatina]
MPSRFLLLLLVSICIVDFYHGSTDRLLAHAVESEGSSNHGSQRHKRSTGWTETSGVKLDDSGSILEPDNSNTGLSDCKAKCERITECVAINHRSTGGKCEALSVQTGTFVTPSGQPWNFYAFDRSVLPSLEETTTITEEATTTTEKTTTTTTEETTTTTTQEITSAPLDDTTTTTTKEEATTTTQELTTTSLEETKTTQEITTTPLEETTTTTTEETTATHEITTIQVEETTTRQEITTISLTTTATTTTATSFEDTTATPKVCSQPKKKSYLYGRLLSGSFPDSKHSIGITTHVTKLQCAILCASRFDCEGFTFRPEGGACVLFGTKLVHIPPSDIESDGQSQNVVYFEEKMGVATRKVRILWTSNVVNVH